jgi:hypothetical protein
MRYTKISDITRPYFTSSQVPEKMGVNTTGVNKKMILLSEMI